MRRNEDQVDVEKVLAGDVSAFEEIVRRWQGPLVNLAFRFCRHRGRAEEMAQEAFLRAYRALGKWRKDSAFSTWLFTLAVNLYRSELRRIPCSTVSLDDIAEPRDWRPMDGGLENEERKKSSPRLDSLSPLWMLFARRPRHRRRFRFRGSAPCPDWWLR